MGHIYRRQQKTAGPNKRINIFVFPPFLFLFIGCMFLCCTRPRCRIICVCVCLSLLHLRSASGDVCVCVCRKLLRVYIVQTAGLAEDGSTSSWTRVPHQTPKQFHTRSVVLIYDLSFVLYCFSGPCVFCFRYSGRCGVFCIYYREGLWI